MGRGGRARNGDGGEEYHIGEAQTPSWGARDDCGERVALGEDGLPSGCWDSVAEAVRAPSTV